MSRLIGRACLAVSLAVVLAWFTPAAGAGAEDDELSRRAHARSGRSKRRTRERSSAESAGGESSQDAEQEEPSNEEVISDPELENAPPTPTSRRTGGDDEVISDPELDDSDPRDSSTSDSGWGEAYRPSGRAGEQDDESPAPRSDDYDPLANTGTARLGVWGQFGADLHHERNFEDAYESRLRFDAEIELRRSKKVRVSVGMRTDLLWALPSLGSQETGDGLTASQALAQGRFELDVLPLSAYVDVTPRSGFHLRLGEQQVSMARADFYSPIDMLAAFDMRGQIGLGQSTGKLAQPAVRMDWDLSSWATLEIVYLPWFMPSLVRPNRDRYVARELGTSGATLPKNLNDIIDPGNQTQANGEFFRFVGPQPNFKTPQVEAHLNMRGNGFEIGISGGTALEKLPSIYVTPGLEKVLRGDGTEVAMTNAQADTFSYLKGERSVLDVEYHRYQQVGIDGSVDIAPLTLGFELAFSPSRHLVAATRDASHLPLPNVSAQIVDTRLPTDKCFPQPTDKNGKPDASKPWPPDSNVAERCIRKGVPLVQGALHLDWVKGETFAIAAEGFFVQALQLPYDTTRDWWGFVKNKGLYAGGILGGTYHPNPDNGRWRFDASVIGLVGPSIIFMPQVEYKALDALFVNVGAQFFEGPIPKDKNGDPVTGGVQNLNVGGLFSGYDQMYVGFRWTP